MAVTATQLNQLYLAYFGRPVDYNGYTFYTNNSASTEATVAAAFSASAESQALYGTGNVAAQVNAIYRNLFNRDAEIDGLNYWVGQITKGIISAPEAALVILRAAVGTDATSVSNKLTVSQSFFNALDTTAEVLGYAGTAAANAARAYIASVGFTAASLTAAQASLDATVANVVGIGGPAGQTITLTTGLDTANGTAGNDTIIGTSATLTALDTINGGDGTDHLQYNDLTGGNNPAALGATVTSVEVVDARSAAAATINTSSWAGVTALNVTQGTSAGVTAAGTTNVSISGITGAVVEDGGLNVTVSSATSGAAITIGATTVAAGSVSVTHAKQAAGAIAIDGGTSVSVAASGVTTGTVSIGQGGATTDLPSGAVAVSSTGAASVAATPVTLGAITVSGGSTVNVNQVATSSSAAAAADTVGATITQSAVTVNGGAGTTSVTVTESAPVAAVAAVAAVAGANETQTITFGAMTAGQTLTVDGLTFTAAKALTAAQAAAAFANLAKGATQGSAPAGNGVYSGTAGALFTSGAVATSGTTSTVTYTSVAKANEAAIVIGGTAAGTSITATVDGSASTDATTGVLGVTGGAVVVNGAIAGTDVLASATLGGYASASVTSDALTSLTLANSNGAVTVTNAAATSLALSLSGVGTQLAGAAAAIGIGGTYTTLNLAATGADSMAAITGAGVLAVNVSGDKNVDLTGSVMAAVKTATVTGSAGVTADLSGAAGLTSVNASGTSGNNTVTIDASKATYTGGSGVDKVTLSSTTVSKAIDLGAGDDSLTLAAGTTTLGIAVTGGAGTDTLVMAAADAATASTTDTFETKIDSFEKLSLKVAGTDVVNLANMDDISYVISAGNTVSLTLDKMASGGTLELTGTGVLTNVNLTDATGTADSLNIVTKVGLADVAFGNIAAAGVESISLTATDTSTKAAINTATLTVTDSALKTMTITGNANVTLTTTSAALTSLDGSAMTGKLTASTNGTVAETILGGAGKDVLTSLGNGDTLNGGAGADTLIVQGNLTNLVGGAGADVFNVSKATTNVNSYATITDLASGDSIKFAASAANFMASKVTLGDTAVFQDYANAIVNSTAAGDVAWFQFAGNTYAVENVADLTTFTNGTDIIVKITGLVDLSTASFSSSADTLVIA